ncbi:hypothetical protein Hanom_Chr13g01195411 [Helianthus anomalus]
MMASTSSPSALNRGGTPSYFAFLWIENGFVCSLISSILYSGIPIVVIKQKDGRNPFKIREQDMDKTWRQTT